jgi:hypothetical protein
MDSDRKYRQRGYNDSERDTTRSDRPRTQGPKLPIDVTGPRLPRLVQAVTASRCYNCGTTLTDVDYRGKCPKCAAALHCCKQCAHFEPSTRFQCLKPIPARIPSKDQVNECELFKARVTVAREATQAQPPSTNGSSARVQESGSPSNARAAFDNLFKK